MKSFLVYVKGHEASESQMKAALKSLSNSNFDVELLEGATPKTLHEYDDVGPHAIGSRANNFYDQSPDKIYLTKKSCFTNHVRVWKKCVDLGEPVAFLEHDVGCVRNWDNPKFKELLILNIQSAWKQPVFHHVNSDFYTWNLGVNMYNNAPLVYNKPVEKFKGSYMIPGTAAYAIQPHAAEKLLNTLDQVGWEQSDFFINTKTVHMEYVTPEYFTFKSNNLNMSHGY